MRATPLPPRRALRCRRPRRSPRRRDTERGERSVDLRAIDAGLVGGSDEVVERDGHAFGLARLEERARPTHRRWIHTADPRRRRATRHPPPPNGGGACRHGAPSRPACAGRGVRSLRRWRRRASREHVVEQHAFEGVLAFGNEGTRPVGCVRLIDVAGRRPYLQFAASERTIAPRRHAEVEGTLGFVPVESGVRSKHVAARGGSGLGRVIVDGAHQASSLSAPTERTREAGMAAVSTNLTQHARQHSAPTPATTRSSTLGLLLGPVDAADDDVASSRVRHPPPPAGPPRARTTDAP